jgi:ABC-type antimicrobial peptide transport system permease subunit
MTIGMLANNLKIAWRNLARNKVYSFINIAGLATGMAVTMLIALWIYDEVSFNHNFKNYRSIVQVMVYQSANGESGNSESMATPVGKALAADYPADFEHVSFVSWGNDILLSHGEKKISAYGRLVQPSFSRMFTLNMREGNIDALADPTTLLISESMATALFGTGNATGNIIRLNNKQQMKIGGVYQDFPHNSSFYDSKVLLPWDIDDNHMKNSAEWENHNAMLFAQLAENADLIKTGNKIRDLPTPHIKRWHEEIVLQPMPKMHLYDEFVNGKAVTGRIRFVWMFGIIGLFVLMVACINFMNLSTARSEKRAKEVGIRKSVGALRRQVMKQFLNESVMVALISFLFALVLVILALPYFNQLSDKQITIDWRDPYVWIVATGFTVLTGMVAGSYPAFYLSAFNPVKVLKGTFKAGKAALIPRRVLVVVQFTVSIALIIGTIVVFRQIDFARSRPVGYSREGLITVPFTDKLQPQFDALRNELLASGIVDNIAASSQTATHFSNNNSIEWAGKDPSLVRFFRDVNVTHDFGRTIRWDVVQGRDFSTEHPSDSSAAIINEAALKIMNFKDPVGQIIKYGGKEFTIVGVVQDMITQSPYAPLEPSVFFCSGWLQALTIRISSKVPVHKALDQIAGVFKKYDPETPFGYRFVDDEYAKKFTAEEKIGNLAGFFAVFAIFISCLGLFGLSSYVAEQRTREIGLRKVLGASVLNVWQLLSKEFVVLTFVSFAIATPVAAYFMNNWLNNYSYRVDLSWWIFAVTAASSFIITLLTVSFQAIRAGLANPVKSLRTE